MPESGPYGAFVERLSFFFAIRSPLIFSFSRSPYFCSVFFKWNLGEVGKEERLRGECGAEKEGKSFHENFLHP